MTLTSIERLPGKPDADRWFKNEDTGRVWRVRCAWTAAQPANIVPASDGPPDVAPPPTAIGVHISVSWCEVDGELRFDADGAPMVFEGCNRTLGEIDFIRDGFDPDEAIGELVVERIVAAEAVLAGRGRLIDAMERWQRDEASGPDRVRLPTLATALDRVVNETPGTLVPEPVPEPEIGSPI